MAEIGFDEKDPENVTVPVELFPSESYVGENYWADLPFEERSRWMMTQQVRKCLHMYCSLQNVDNQRKESFVLNYCVNALMLYIIRYFFLLDAAFC